MQDKSAIYLLHDFIFDTFERGREAKLAYDQAKSNAPDDMETIFQSGVTMTYYTILDSLFNRIKQFELEEQLPIIQELNVEDLL